MSQEHNTSEQKADSGMRRIEAEHIAARISATAAEDMLKMICPDMMIRLKDAYELGFIAGIRSKEILP